VRYAWIVMLVIGCYEAPDYSGTHFKCDSEHACPAGQQCVNGVCNGGGNMIDAPISSAGVLCGTTTCGATQKCCADFVNGLACIAQSASCTGFSATCDGREDCGSMRCCETGSLVIGCTATCVGQAQLICRDNTDCTDSGQSVCCPTVGTMEPWGRCAPACP
jgi:hypothetical protein